MTGLDQRLADSIADSLLTGCPCGWEAPTGDDTLPGRRRVRAFVVRHRRECTWDQDAARVAGVEE